MHEEDSLGRFKNLKYVRFGDLEMFSVDPLRIDNWIIKASSSSFDSILIVMQNIFSGEVQVGLFSDEVNANIFVSHWIQTDNRKREKIKGN